jgi:hypothetical protein
MYEILQLILSLRVKVGHLFGLNFARICTVKKAVLSHMTPGLSKLGILSPLK